MPLRINSNVTSIAAQRSLDKSQRQVEKSLKALATGSRIVSAGDDAAGFAISEGLRGQISGIKQAKFNTQNATSLIQTAEGALNEQNNILIRMRELAVNAASDTVSDTEREFLDLEFQQLVSELDRIALSTQYGSKKLLEGNGGEYEFHVGPFQGPENVIRFRLDANTTAGALEVSGLEVLDQDAAIDTLEYIDQAVKKISGTRATFGAVQSRFQFVNDNLAVQHENLENARSLIADVDAADEVTKLTQSQIMLDFGTSVLAQANADPRRALSLLT